MEEVTQQKNSNPTINAGDLIGKKVITEDGKELGKVGELVIDKTDLSLRGIIVKRGLITKDLFVGHNFIKKLSKKGALLTVTPYIETTKIKVFDTQGSHIGIIKSIKWGNNSNKIISIVIDQKTKSITKTKSSKK